MKGVFSRSNCCYANLFCYENDNNMFTNDWAFFASMIIASMIKSCYNEASKFKCYMETVLSHLTQRSCDKEGQERYITIDGKVTREEPHIPK